MQRPGDPRATGGLGSQADVDLPSGAGLAHREGASPALVGILAKMERRVPRLAGVLGLGGGVYGRFSRHRGSILAGGLAFFAMLSLVPALISLGAVAGLLVDPQAFQAGLLDLLAGYPDVAAQLEPILTSIFATWLPEQAGLGSAGLISLAVALYAASRFVYVGRQVLDAALENEPKPASLLGRILAIGITLAVQLVAVASVVLLTTLPALADSLGVGELIPELTRNLQLPVTAAVCYLLLTLSMRYGSDRKGAVPWVNGGAALGTLMVLLGSAGLGTYLAHSNTYGAAVAVLGSVVALELWLYVIALAIVISAEFEAVRMGL